MRIHTSRSFVRSLLPTACALIVLAILQGCTSGAIDMRQPSLLDQLANSSLSPVSPPPARGQVEYSSGRPGEASQFFAGDAAAGGLRTPSRPGISQSADGYELNFANAELSELVRVILKDTLGVPYVFDERVRGQVTISTGRAIPRQELLLLLESVLNMNRAAVIRDGEVLRIVPAGEARATEVGSIDYGQEAREIGPGYGLSVIALKYVSAEAMLDLLKSFAPDSESVRTAVHENLLIIRGTARDRQALLGVAATFDVDWMRGQSAALFTLKHASPRDVTKELEEIFETGSGRGKGLVRFQTIDRMNAILALSSKPQHLRDVGQWVKRLDREGAEADGYYVYRVEHGKAKDLADILNETFATGIASSRSRGSRSEGRDSRSREGFTISSRSGDRIDERDEEPSGNRSADQAEPSSESAGTAIGFLASAAQPASGSSGIRIIADEVNNKLLIKAAARDYEKILGILRRIDQPPLQVLILATLAEVTLNDNLAYGVQFFLQKRDGAGGAFGFSNGFDLNIAPALPGLNYIIGSTATPKVVLDALASETSVKVVSSPSVVVVHNQTATLQVGDEVPVATRSAQSVTDSNAPVVNEIQFRNTGVILKVTPRVNSSGLVTMDIEQEISAVVTTEAVGEGETLTPTISQRRIASTIAVQSGQMVLLGGLISEQFNDEKKRVPLLRDVPYLGEIVGDTERRKARTELIVFLRPVVIRNSEDASQVAEALRAGLQSLAPRPLPREFEEEGPRFKQ